MCAVKYVSHREILLLPLLCTMERLVMPLQQKKNVLEPELMPVSVAEVGLRSKFDVA